MTAQVRAFCPTRICLGLRAAAGRSPGRTRRQAPRIGGPPDEGSVDRAVRAAEADVRGTDAALRARARPDPAPPAWGGRALGDRCELAVCCPQTRLVTPRSSRARTGVSEQDVGQKRPTRRRGRSRCAAAHRRARGRACRAALPRGPCGLAARASRLAGAAAARARGGRSGRAGSQQSLSGWVGGSTVPPRRDAPWRGKSGHRQRGGAQGAASRPRRKDGWRAREAMRATRRALAGGASAGGVGAVAGPGCTDLAILRAVGVSELAADRAPASRRAAGGRVSHMVAAARSDPRSQGGDRAARAAGDP